MPDASVFPKESLFHLQDVASSPLPEGLLTGSVAFSLAQQGPAQRDRTPARAPADPLRVRVMGPLGSAREAGKRLPSVAPTPLTSCRSAAVRSGTRLYTWLLSAMGGSASSKRPRGNSCTSSATAARADPGRRGRVTEAERGRGAPFSHRTPPRPGAAALTGLAPQRLCLCLPSFSPPLQPKGVRDQALPLPAHLPGSQAVKEEVGVEGRGHQDGVFRRRAVTSGSREAGPPGGREMTWDQRGVNLPFPSGREPRRRTPAGIDFLRGHSGLGTRGRRGGARLSRVKRPSPRAAEGSARPGRWLIASWKAENHLRVPPRLLDAPAVKLSSAEVEVEVGGL